MIQVSIKEIIESAQSFKELSQKEIRTRTSFKIARIIKALEQEYKIFCEEREKIMQKYCIKMESGEVKIEKEKTQFFNSEIEDLINTTIDLNVSPIKLEELEDISVTPALLISISPFIEE